MSHARGGRRNQAALRAPGRANTRVASRTGRKRGGSKRTEHAINVIAGKRRPGGVGDEQWRRFAGGAGDYVRALQCCQRQSRVIHVITNHREIDGLVAEVLRRLVCLGSGRPHHGTLVFDE